MVSSFRTTGLFSAPPACRAGAPQHFRCHRTCVDLLSPQQTGPAPVHPFEIPIRKFVSSFLIGILVRIDPQIPLSIFREAMLLDVFVLFLRGWLMFAPHLALIKDHLLLPYEVLRVLERLV